jgi:CBS domain-containing protein/sporulation protein YlmC with PRC-barrel domain
MKIFVYFSELLKKEVLGSNNKLVGRVYDIALNLTAEIYPKAEALIIKKGIFKKRFCEVSWDVIEDFDGIIRLKKNLADLEFKKEAPRHEFCINIDFLDQQVVDTSNQKVVRVNDVHLLRVDHQLYLAHVDVGLRGLVRRLGWERFIDFFAHLIRPKANYLTREDLISWKHTQPLSIGRTKNVIRLDIARQKLSQIPPPELKEIMLDLDAFQRVSLFKSLDTALKQKVFTEFNLETQQDILEKLEDKEAVSVLEAMPTDEAADLLLSLSREKVDKLMNLMETSKSKRLSQLLGYSGDSAGGLMTTEYISIDKNATVEQALLKLKEFTFQAETIYYVYIVDEQHHLIATTSLRRLLTVNPTSSILEARFPRHLFVRTEDSVKEIAYLMDKYKCSAIPVVNKDNVMQGVITVDDVLGKVIPLAWRRFRKRKK